MFKLDLEKPEEPDIKLPTSIGLSKLQKNFYFCFIDYTKAFDCMDHNKLWKILQEMGIPDHLTCFLRNLYAGQEATVRTGHGNNRLVPNRKRSSSRLYIVTLLMAESEEELKSLLMKVKVESEKVGLKLNIQKTEIMASGPITSWEIDGETMETVSDFIFGGSRITAGVDCSHEIKRCLLLGRKVMTNLDSIFKSRDITLPTKHSQGYGFSSGHVWM